MGGTDAADGQSHSWAVTIEGYQSMRERMRGLELSTLGVMVVNADAGRRVSKRTSLGNRPSSVSRELTPSKHSRVPDEMSRTAIRVLRRCWAGIGGDATSRVG